MSSSALPSALPSSKQTLYRDHLSSVTREGGMGRCKIPDGDKICVSLLVASQNNFSCTYAILKPKQRRAAVYEIPHFFKAFQIGLEKLDTQMPFIFNGNQTSELPQVFFQNLSQNIIFFQWCFWYICSVSVQWNLILGALTNVSYLWLVK